MCCVTRMAWLIHRKCWTRLSVHTRSVRSDGSTNCAANHHRQQPPGGWAWGPSPLMFETRRSTVCIYLYIFVSLIFLERVGIQTAWKCVDFSVNFWSFLEGLHQNPLPTIGSGGTPYRSPTNGRYSRCSNEKFKKNSHHASPTFYGREW